MITDYNGYAGSPSKIEFSEAAPESTKTNEPDRIVSTAYVRGVEHRCIISKICGGVYDEYAGSYGDDDRADVGVRRCIASRRSLRSQSLRDLCPM
jgi:hypothetical protein